MTASCSCLPCCRSRHNRNVMKQMQKLFKDGGKVIWVAPSGGRDRTDENGNFVVAPFDAKSMYATAHPFR